MINRIEENFNIKLYDDLTPYIQADEEKRMYLFTNSFEGKKSSLIKLVEFLFDSESNIDTSFLKAYIPNGFRKPIRTEKQVLHGAIQVNNWKEYYYTEIEFETTLIFATVEDIKSSEVIEYIRSIMDGKKETLISFYNDYYFITVDADEINIIVKDIDLLKELKLFLHDLDYNRFYNPFEL